MHTVQRSHFGAGWTQRWQQRWWIQLLGMDLASQNASLPLLPAWFPQVMVVVQPAKPWAAPPRARAGAAAPRGRWSRVWVQGRCRSRGRCEFHSCERGRSASSLIPWRCGRLEHVQRHWRLLRRRQLPSRQRAATRKIVTPLRLY